MIIYYSYRKPIGGFISSFVPQEASHVPASRSPLSSLNQEMPSIIHHLETSAFTAANLWLARKTSFSFTFSWFWAFAKFFVLFLWCSAKTSTSRSFSNDTQWHLRLMMASFCYQLYWITEFSGNIESMTLALATRVFLETIVLWVLRHDDSIKYLMGSPEIYILFYNF